MKLWATAFSLRKLIFSSNLMFLSVSSHFPSFVFSKAEILDCMWISYLQGFPQTLTIILQSQLHSL